MHLPLLLDEVLSSLLTFVIIIFIINCIYIVPIQNISFYDTAHETNVYKDFKNKLH